MENPDNLNKKYDLITLFDVIEHIKDDKSSIKKIKNLLKKKGYLMITVPAFQILWSYHDEIHHHYRRYRIKDILNLINKDYILVYKSYYNFFLFLPILFFRLVNKLLNTKKIDVNYSKNSILDSIFYSILKFESFLLKVGLRLPFGVSLVVLLQNKD